MVGGFPRKQAPAPKPVEVEIAAAQAEFDEDGRRIITTPVVPAQTRPPATVARSVPPMPCPPRPGSLPPRPPAPAAIKRAPPPAYVRKPPVTGLDPNDVDLGSYSPRWGKR